MNYTGTIKLVYRENVVDSKIYCSREDRENIVKLWEFTLKYFYESHLQIRPSLSRTESRKLRTRFDNALYLERLQEESKRRNDGKVVDFDKMRKFVYEPPPKFERPPAIYDNNRSFYEK